MDKLIVAISLAALLIPGVAGANLLVNSGFESLDVENGQMPGWSNAGPDGWNNNIFSTGDNPHSGARAARNFWDGAVWQDVPVTGRQEYRLTGWAFIPSGLGGSAWNSFMKFRWLRADGTIAGFGTFIVDFTEFPRDQYNQGVIDFQVAPADAVTARIIFGTWSDPPWLPVHPTDFDDFDFSPIPEPASLLLLGTGLFSLFAARKRVIK